MSEVISTRKAWKGFCSHFDKLEASTFVWKPKASAKICSGAIVVKAVIRKKKPKTFHNFVMSVRKKIVQSDFRRSHNYC